MGDWDSIREALIEIRFASRLPSELVVGKIAANPAWASFEPKRLPTADIPAPIREMDQNLKFQAVLQLVRPDERLLVKVGDGVVSLHCLRPYPGWLSFSREICEFSKYFFDAVAPKLVLRMGLRYVNGLSQNHFFSSPSSLNLNISIGNNSINSEFNLNYLRQSDSGIDLVVRLASPRFVSGLASEEKFLVDLDAYSDRQFSDGSAETVAMWSEEAHDMLKREFLIVVPTAYKQAITRESAREAKNAGD